MIAVAMTGLGSVKDKDRALAEGFQKCIIKPVEPERLIEQLQQLLLSRPHPAPRQ
jgi:CheY-like chemotaxis protein